jgi:hypothetical protein
MSDLGIRWLIKVVLTPRMGWATPAHARITKGCTYYDKPAPNKFY